jgi:hypothetical protein
MPFTYPPFAAIALTPFGLAPLTVAAARGGPARERGLRAARRTA